MGDNVYRFKSCMPFQRRCYLALRRRPCIEHDGVDIGPQVSQDRSKVGNCRVDEQNF
jgi:hypothetical protein